MNILNRYILRKFINPFLASFLALCIIIFVSQLFDRLDRFLANGVQWKHAIGYLLTSMPYQAVQILPVACLLGTLFVVGDLARNREYIAGLAGGVPPEKFLGGILFAGVIISLISLFINETIVPPVTRYSEVVFREKIKHITDWRAKVFNDLFVAGSNGRMWSIKEFDQDQGRMTRPVVDTYQSGSVVSQIDAREASWKIDGWLFRNGVIRTFKSNSMEIEKIDPFNEVAFPFEERPSDLTIQEPEPYEMSSKTLRKQIERLESLGVPTRKFEVELRMKLSLPLTCFVVTFLGIPLALRGKGNRAKGIASAGILALVYMGFVQFGKAMAQRVIPPLLGAWMGNIVFIAIGLGLWMKMRRTV